MTSAGWYPDPAGQPQTYRYWDGSSWSQVTTTNPYDAAPGAVPPPPPQQPPTPPTAAPPPSQQPTGQPGYPPAPPPAAPGGGYGGYGQQPPYGGPGGGSGGGAGRTALIVVLVVLLVVALGVGGFFGVRALTDDDDGGSTADDPTSEVTDATDATDGTANPSDPTDTGSAPTTPATEDTSTITPTSEQCNGGDPVGDPPAGDTLQGGGLSLPVPRGYDIDSLGQGTVFTFADDVQLALRQIEESWIAIYGVGAVPRDAGFDSTAQAAEVITQCMTRSDDFYSGFSGREDLENGPITVDGHSAHSVLAEVRVDNPDVQAEGDVLQVVVVDTGSPDSYGLYISMAPIGDEDLIALQERTLAKIQVG